MVIASGLKRSILDGLFAGEAHGTFFVPKKERLASRKCWIGFTLKPKGTITVDNGAAEAVLQRGKSLLPSGVISVDGDFEVGAPVAVGTASKVFGTGLVNYSAAEIRKIMGLKSGQIKKRLGAKPYDEVIHRDNLAITGDG
jgi:glutamate 5-kinase